jgi:hypothetical protein
MDVPGMSGPYGDREEGRSRMTVEGTDPAAKAELIAEIAQLLEDLRANRRDHIDAGDWIEDHGERVLAALRDEPMPGGPR